MNSQAIFQYIFDQIETPFLQSVGQLVTALIDYAAAPVQIAVVIYVAMTGLLMMRGQASEAVGGLLGRLVGICVVVWFMTNGSVYTTWVQDFFLNVVPKEITQVISSAGNGSTTVDANSFDAIWNKSYQAGLRVWRLLNSWDVGEEIVVILFWAAALFACLFCFLIWFISHIALGLFIIAGPLLLWMVLFPATKAIFERWIGAMISCVLLQIFTVTMVSLILMVEGQMMVSVINYTGRNPWDQLGMLLAAVMFFGMAGFVALQLPSFATALAGGLHFHVGAVARTLVTGTAKTVQQTRKTASQVGSQLKQDARQAYQRIRPTTGGSLSRSSTPRA